MSTKPPAVTTNNYRDRAIIDLDAVVGTSVRLSGWVTTRRDHGGVLFVELRDEVGQVQVVFNKEDDELHSIAQSLSKESVVSVQGRVVERPAGTENTSASNGAVELVASEMLLLSKAKELPFELNTEQAIREEVRLANRFLDLRSERMQKNIRLRSQIIQALRDEMLAADFIEVQTPILTSSSPEGARDYIVPSRRFPGQFYALPQAPQQFKQLLMASGFERYFQIAPCFRDEDGRADRSPGEFYQLDIEMAFATQEDVFEITEQVLDNVFEKFSDRPRTRPPYPRIPYKDAMLKYGTDKPDLRNPLSICDASYLFVGSEFRAFSDKCVRVICLPDGASQSRSFFDGMEDFAKSVGAPGLAWIKFGESVTGPIAKFLSTSTVEDLQKLVSAENGDVVFFVADSSEDAASRVAGAVRTELGDRMELFDTNEYRFCWVVDFPMYERSDDGTGVDFSHNPFSMPQGGMSALDAEDPEDILAFQYDIVCNGLELSSGAVRNHDPELMIKAFGIAGYDPEVVRRKFPALYKAFQYGVPPHAGVAPGVDRIVMLLLDEDLIRDVVAFPMTVSGRDLLMGAPDQVSERQLDEVHIAVLDREE